MKKFLNKKTILITCISLLLIVGIGSTVAYVIAKTALVKNTFKPTDVSCKVYADGGITEISGASMSAQIINDVQIKNTGNTDAYIRVALVVNWSYIDSSSKTHVWAHPPQEGDDGDYTLDLNLAESDDWFKGSDGFYYCKKPISATEMTSVLLNSVNVNKENAPVGTDGTRYYFSIEIVASAIQANPDSVVQDHWGVTVENNNIVSK